MPHIEIIYSIAHITLSNSCVFCFVLQGSFPGINESIFIELLFKTLYQTGLSFIVSFRLANQHMNHALRPRTRARVHGTSSAPWHDLELRTDLNQTLLVERRPSSFLCELPDSALC